jgi:hypothetical protein
MFASQTKSKVADFYNSLVMHGKHKMVTFTVLICKLLIITNAKLRDFYANSIHPGVILKNFNLNLFKFLKNNS